MFKCFEKCVLQVLLSQVRVSLDPYQFAYKAGRSAEDAVLIFLNNVLKHLETPKTYVRTLFVDFSSAFNTIQPHLMVEKLLSLGVDYNLTAWLFDFLTCRTQFVTFNTATSSTIRTNTGAPQGCVLSPILYIIYTNDFRTTNANTRLIKFADDSTLQALISTSETEYFDEVKQFVNWCENNYLEVNVSKTKEVIFDFRQIKDDITPLCIKDKEVELADTYKYLGVNIDNKLNWHCHLDAIITKANQRLYFLRKLRSFEVRSCIMKMFYTATIQSVLTYAITCWGGNTTQYDKNRIDSVIKKASKIMHRAELPAFEQLYTSAIVKRGQSIMSDKSHLLHSEYVVSERSGRLISKAARTERYLQSFVPHSVRAIRDGK